MKNTTIKIAAALYVLTALSCSGGAGTTVTPTPTTTTAPCGDFLNRRYPHLDTMTLWHLDDHNVRDGGYAKITAGGYYNVVGTVPTQNGSYYLCVGDTAGSGVDFYTFQGYRLTGDYVCGGNEFLIRYGASGRRYATLVLCDGKTTSSTFLDGNFVDSL